MYASKHDWTIDQQTRHFSVFLPFYEQIMCSSHNNLCPKYQKRTYLGIPGHSKKVEWPSQLIKKIEWHNQRKKKGSRLAKRKTVKDSFGYILIWKYLDIMYIIKKIVDTHYVMTHPSNNAAQKPTISSFHCCSMTKFDLICQYGTFYLACLK